MMLFFFRQATDNKFCLYIIITTIIAFSCTICVDYFESPYTLQCGKVMRYIYNVNILEVYY